MNAEDRVITKDVLKKRRRRFGTFLLAALLTILPAATVFAATYTVVIGENNTPSILDPLENPLAVGTELGPDDAISIGSGGVYHFIYGNNHIIENEEDDTRAIQIRQRCTYAGISHHGTENDWPRYDIQLNVAAAPVEEEPPKEEVEEEDHTPINPDAIGAFFYEKGSERASERAKIGKQEQGPLAMNAFNAAIPKNWHSAFTMTLTIDDQQNNDRKDGTFKLFIPGAYQKLGRKYAVLALGVNGVQMLTNTADTKKYPYVFTSPVDIQGCAFMLIYMD
ncbi:MAG: hypothetical protein K6G22_08045 [Lachnospiraceae bacterium]|nr:hypothetical protein [Lachnospiraceae bacterium]